MIHVVHSEEHQKAIWHAEAQNTLTMSRDHQEACSKLQDRMDFTLGKIFWHAEKLREES